MATSLSQAYTTIIHPKHIIPLDFESVLDLPESHVWAPSPDEDRTLDLPESHLLTQADGDTSGPPVIDLQAPDVEGLVGDACRRWGVFQVTNHGVPSGLVEEVEEHARQLFALPADRKRKALRSPTGVTGYGVARISPFFSKLMWHEGFTIMGSAVDHAKELWPHEYEEFW